ncbi:transcription termination factor 5, mitochondrial-like isoform X1 [Vespa mandarinia]|uniref:transcription termination factor 5, mitochondrial-like isoform X1 n=1 Tax=Vespa mandarinia TaxID=7446 RepID=UPI001619FBF9|nr:transcription termination factor 5, mitochondrial-like isoform X1 [Vespa mandarinia]
MYTKLLDVRFNRHITIRLFYQKSLSKINLRNILLKNFRNTSKNIDDLLKKYGNKILKIPKKNIIQNSEMCHEYNIKTGTLKNIVTCLNIKSHIFRHRIFLLEEMGVSEMDINIIWKLEKYFNLPANEFKKIMKIPMDQHIMTNMLSHINNDLSDAVPPLNLLVESLPVNMHYEKCFSYYIVNKLNSDEIQSKYKGRKFKSFRLMTKLINILINNFDIDYEYIRNHLIILDMCPNQVQYVLDNLKDTRIINLTIQEVFKRFHEILLCDPENIKKLLNSFTKYELDNKILINCLRIFKLRNEDFIDRMEKLLTMPDLRVWCKTPRILYFILDKNVINERIKFLRNNGYIKNTNLYLLTSDRTYFDRYKKGEFNFSRKLKYIKYILHKELGYDKKDLMNKFKRHQYWNKVSFVDLDDTLRIMKKNFSIEDIYHNIHIILYPWSTISKILKSIQESDVYKNYTPSQQLALCLYFLEKDNHFTGDGIWNMREEEKQLQSNKEINDE